MSSTPHENNSFLRRFVLSTQPALTKLAHGSAPFITTFVLIHLTAPVMATLGGTSLASQVMILGREYYQTPFGEKYLVFAPLVTHALSATAKRLLAPRPARKITSVLSITGYTLAAVTLLHVGTHRFLPANPDPPIFAVGPAELDYEYVKLALHEYPWRSWLGYVAFTACVAQHAAEGMVVIWNTWLKGKLGAMTAPRKTRMVGALIAVLPVVSGLYVMYKEPSMLFESQAARLRAALTSSPAYMF